MIISIYSLRVVFFMALIFVGSRGECKGIANMAALTVGACKEYEIVLPREGYDGAPLSISTIPNFGKPIKDENFTTRLIRVTILAVHKYAGGRRVVLRIDEIDPKGDTVVNGLFYTYLDTLPHGIHAVVCRCSNDGNDSDESTVFRYGIPFPFTCARPPAWGFKNGRKDGYVTSAGQGVEFARKDGNAQPNVINVEATRFEVTHWVGKAPSSTAAYRRDIERVKNNSRTKVLFREKQQWDKANAWLWDEMERADEAGTLLMRCKKK